MMKNVLLNVQIILNALLAKFVSVVHVLMINRVLEKNVALGEIVLRIVHLIVLNTLLANTMKIGTVLKNGLLKEIVLLIKVVLLANHGFLIPIHADLSEGKEIFARAFPIVVVSVST
ncbi:MAG: hypothetical protein IKQ24_08935 [Verrucomicrobia bacterium]|nr:hypothetical protein [Verrucomicrobiota bacterium]